MIGIAVCAILIGIGVGSVFVSPVQIFQIFMNQIFQVPLPSSVQSIYVGLILQIRLPRVILAFCVGAALAVSGTIMQSVLKNPLASSFGLGVTSGAGLGAVLVMMGGFASGMLGTFLLPVVGLVFGLATVFLSISLASRLDKNMSNYTIILTGMVLSLFINAIMSMLASTSKEYSQRITLWQLGSFSLKEWRYVFALFPIVLLCILFFMRYAKELDILTFGEEQANIMGIETKKVKRLLIGMTAVLTGTAVSFVGIIGFVDLIAPHVVRRMFGSDHRYVIPMSALFGGSFMVIADLFARTLISPSEIPIGSITAIIGAPFFIYVFFRSRKEKPL
ncbi:MAG: FecCD family ABC transporter permease [Velocimicrobium sp.]